MGRLGGSGSRIILPVLLHLLPLLMLSIFVSYCTTFLLFRSPKGVHTIHFFDSKIWPHPKCRGKNFGGGFLDSSRHSGSDSGLRFTQKIAVWVLPGLLTLIVQSCTSSVNGDSLNGHLAQL